MPPVPTMTFLPPGVNVGTLGPSTTATGPIDYGDYMSVAIKYPSVCTETLLTNSVDDQLFCVGASAWPFFPSNSNTAATGVGLVDVGIGAANPP
ncbi:MAG TPA: hypothetical protein VGH87_04725 [Polyangiaceae bacterium]